MIFTLFEVDINMTFVFQLSLVKINVRSLFEITYSNGYLFLDLFWIHIA